MKFHWPLQRLLDVTNTQEKAIKAKLFEVACRIASAQEQLVRHESVLRALLHEMSGMDLEDRMNRQELFMRCATAQKHQIAQVHEQIRQLEEQREAVKTELVAIMNKRENLEKLRTEARRDYDRMLNLCEQKQLDEAFLVGYARRRQPKLTLRSA